MDYSGNRAARHYSVQAITQYSVNVSYFIRNKSYRCSFAILLRQAKFLLDFYCFKYWNLYALCTNSRSFSKKISWLQSKATTCCGVKLFRHLWVTGGCKDFLRRYVEGL